MQRRSSLREAADESSDDGGRPAKRRKSDAYDNGDDDTPNTKRRGRPARASSKPTPQPQFDEEDGSEFDDSDDSNESGQYVRKSSNVATYQAGNRKSLRLTCVA